MSRFQNLEFNEPEKGRQEALPRLKDVAYYAEEARVAFEGGRFEHALRAYGKVLEHDPRHVGAWVGQVRMLIELGDYQEAKLWADKALEAFPEEPECLAAKAVALARTGDMAAAMAYSDAAIGERGNTPYVWLARADVLLTRGDRQAGWCVDKALSLAALEWFWVWLASRMHSFHKQFGKALQLAQRAVDQSSERAVVWLQLGECRRALGMMGAARLAFETARQLDPSCVVAGGFEGGEGGVAGWLTGLWRRWFGG